MFGIACGSLAAYKWMPIQREMELSNAMLRKRWMRYPMVAGVFGLAYFCSLQLPTRFFQKIGHRNQGITEETYRGQADIVGRFRLFESGNEPSAAEDRVLDYLAMYDKDPLSKPELLDHIVKRITKHTDLNEIFQVKRVGKDQNPIFWAFGKIHGLENIAFCDSQELLAAKGNPVLIQSLVNKVSPKNAPGVGSFAQAE